MPSIIKCPKGIGAWAALAALLVAHASPSLACSTAAWSSVTGSPQAIGPDTSPKGKSYEGVCGLTANASSPSYVTTAAPSGESSLAIRFYLFPAGLNISSGSVTVLSAEGAGSPHFQLQVRNIGGVNHLVTRYRENGNLKEHPNQLPLLDTWQGIELAWSAGAGSGALSVKLDGLTGVSRNNIANGGDAVDSVKFGVVETGGASGQVVVDAFELRLSGPIGLLTVNELLNISTRAEARTGDEIVIGGFVISGDTEKCIVVRGRGQSVNAPTGETRLSDPVLELKSGSATLAVNDNWQDAPWAPIVQTLGRAPAHVKDAAIYDCLAPGAYTALLRGVGGATGIGIVEVYDADEGTPWLANISTRARVGTGNKVAIGGFIIDGAQNRQVLVRGRGPTVGAPAGVQRLANPKLRLVNASGVTLGSNDDWQQASNAGAIAATGQAPAHAQEAAILVTLPPGGYTAILEGSGGTTGVGIVEVLDRSGGSIQSP